MKKNVLKKLGSITFAFALLLTCSVIPNNTVQAAGNKAIKVTNIKGSTKSIKAGKYFKLETNYNAGKLKFMSSNKDILRVSSQGTVFAIKKGTAKITISLKKKSKINKVIMVHITKGSKADIISKKDFDVSKFYHGGIEYKGKVYDNYMDYYHAGGDGNYLVSYIAENDDFVSDGDWKTFKTSRGIKIGDSLAKVLKAYDNIAWHYANRGDKSFDTDKHISKSLLDFHNEDDIGLRFYLDQNDKVMAIIVGN